MAARRCTICANDYPSTNEYKTCPVCEERTSRFSNITPMPDDEARSIKLHAEFERYYEQRELAREAGNL